MKQILINADSRNLKDVEDGSVQLIVTSPPYPMIEMWDEMFSEMDPAIRSALENCDGNAAFKSMHAILNDVWKECDRVLENNGFVCINIGDATRTIGGNFQLFSNHTEVINCFSKMWYSVLPDIHCRMQSHAHNNYMGLGMYPAGAYVTYEDEYILVFRKGGKRVFKGDCKLERQSSAYFWEERNTWFSDLWDIKGTSQVIGKKKASRERSAAFPFEVPYRLVNMYSVKNDTVLDPFCGLGTTNLACIASERNGIGVDISDSMITLAIENISSQAEQINTVIDQRIEAHNRFIDELPEEKRAKCYTNEPHGFPVKTRQETAIKIRRLKTIEKNDNVFLCEYE